MKLPLWLHNSWRRPVSSLPWLWSSRHSSSLCRRCVKVEQVSAEMQQKSEMRVTMLKSVGVQGALCVRVLDECRQQPQWSAIGLTTTEQKVSVNAVQVTAWYIRVPAADLGVPAAAGDAADHVRPAGAAACVCRQRWKDSRGNRRWLGCRQSGGCSAGGTTAMGQPQKPGSSRCRSPAGCSRGQWERHQEYASAKWCSGGRAWVWSADGPQAEHRIAGQQCAG